VIVLPPSLAGADQVTAADASPGVAPTPVGASGTVAGVTAEDGVEAVLVDTPLVAVTVKVYESPFMRPMTVQVSGPVAHVHCSLPLAGVVESAAVTV
jgi:hypothetical protein